MKPKAITSMKITYLWPFWKKTSFPGHCLLIPKSHYETLIDLPASLVAPLFQNAQLLVRAIEKGLQAEGTFVAINNRVSQSVSHLHIHIVPRHKKDGLKVSFGPASTTKTKLLSSVFRALFNLQLLSLNPKSTNAFARTIMYTGNQLSS